MLQQRVATTIHSYPTQFWLLFGGTFISTTGESLIWPFLTIYSREHFGVSLTAIAGVLAIRTILTLVASFASGFLADRYGRKWSLVCGLAFTAIGYFWMSRVENVYVFALLLLIIGMVYPFFKVGSDSMVADLMPDHQRTDAYALIRMANNAGVAIGPIIGGFLAVISYDYVFVWGSAGMLFYSALSALFIRETLPQHLNRHIKIDPVSGYKPVFKDHLFTSTMAAMTLSNIATVMIFILLPVYLKENFGIAENQYGIILATNALMVVFFQFSVTRITRRYPPLLILAIGVAFSGIGLGCVGLSKGFWFFWASMVITTIGELMASPTATSLTAHLAPEALRARYMSLYSLTMTLSSGLGPVFGGLLNDFISPASIWFGGFFVSLVCVIWFWILFRRFPRAAEPSLQSETHSL